MTGNDATPTPTPEERARAEADADARATLLLKRVGVAFVVGLLVWIGVVVASFGR